MAARRRYERMNARKVRDAVKWLIEQQAGCVHHQVGTTRLMDVFVAIGWRECDDAEPGPNNTFIHHEKWRVCWKIGIQPAGKYCMQTDLDLDFEYPWGGEYNDCYVVDGEICDQNGPVPTWKECQRISRYINGEIMGVIKFQKEMERNNEGSGKPKE